MKWEKIVKEFKNEWVLLEVEKVDPDFSVKEGKVLAHSQDKNEIYKKVLEFRPKSFSIEYTGKIPDDLAVVLLLI